MRGTWKIFLTERITVRNVDVEVTFYINDHDDFEIVLHEISFHDEPIDMYDFLDEPSDVRQKLKHKIEDRLDELVGMSAREIFEEATS